jgi:hypothetical protein
MRLPTLNELSPTVPDVMNQLVRKRCSVTSTGELDPSERIEANSTSESTFAPVSRT